MKWLTRLKNFGTYILFSIMAGAVGYPCVKFILKIIIGVSTYKPKLFDFVFGAIVVLILSLTAFTCGCVVFICLREAIRSLKHDTFEI